MADGGTREGSQADAGVLLRTVGGGEADTQSGGTEIVPADSQGQTETQHLSGKQ